MPGGTRPEAAAAVAMGLLRAASCGGGGCGARDPARSVGGGALAWGPGDGGGVLSAPLPPLAWGCCSGAPAAGWASASPTTEEEREPSEPPPEVDMLA